jgi:hypothetical protein
MSGFGVGFWRHACFSILSFSTAAGAVRSVLLAYTTTHFLTTT